MIAPIDERVDRLLAMSDRRGMVVETVRVKGNEIEIIYATAKPKTADADLINWRRK